MALDMQIVGCHENMHINFHGRAFFLLYIFLPCRPKRKHINNLFASTYVNGAKRVIPSHVSGGSEF